MASGTLKNVASLGFVRTPPLCAERIVAHLLRFTGNAHVLDPTVGEGDFLVPCQANAALHLYGVELSEERCAVARTRLPTATLISSDTEAVQWTPESMDVILANPPYYFIDGQRAEYRIIKRAGETLRPDGIMVAILPARSGWDAPMINHWVRYYTNIRCWKFPDADGAAGQDDGDFAHYTQIVVVGVRRAVPLASAANPARTTLLGWRWRSPKGAESPWGQGYPPPELPTTPLPNPYCVPTALPTPPTWRVTRASEALLLEALATSGAQLTPAFAAATIWQPDSIAERPVMPATGEAHLAADILTGLLDGEPILGPDGVQHVFSSYIAAEWADIEVEAEVLAEQKERGVVRMAVRQLQDHMVLGDLNLGTGEVIYHQGEAVYHFLTPWLSRLATLALARRKPLYELRPARWEMRAVASFGWDKRLPKAPYPGLAPAQQHRVYAMGRALDALGCVAIQGEPGTGKTRQTLAVAKRQSLLWRQPRTIQHEIGGRLPRWGKRLRQAWHHNPRAAALLPRGATIPAALPVLVATPKRVIPTWVSELKGAWPEAESVVIRSYRDIDVWLQRCATTTAPMVLGIVSHSLSRAFDRMWTPAVYERRWLRVQAEGDTGGRWLRVAEDEEACVVLRAKVDADGYLVEGASNPPQTLTAPPLAPGNAWHITRQIVEYHCPSCGALQVAIPGTNRQSRSTANTKPAAGGPAAQNPTAGEGAEAGTAPPASDERQEPVTSRTWFTTKPRQCCACDAPLWMECRTNPRQRGIDYATWEAAVTATGPRHSSAKSTPSKPTWLTGANGARAPYPIPTFAPYEYLRRCYPGCVALAIIDESHNARGRATDIGQSVHNATIAAQTHIYASGTHYGGCLDDLFHYWYRFCPRVWGSLGFSWDDVEEAISEYGVIEQTTKEYEGDARRGSGKTDVRVTTLPAPGISAKLIPHLLNRLVFLNILDVGAYMPPLREFPVVVSMTDPDLRARLEEALATEQAAQMALTAAQRTVWDLEAGGVAAHDPSLATARATLTTAQAAVAAAAQARDAARDYVWQRDLAGHYQTLVNHLQDLASQMNSAAMLAKGTMPRWFAALPFDPRFEVKSRQRDDWGNIIGEELIAASPTLEANYLYPLERELIRTVARETAEPLDPAHPERTRTVMVYFEQNNVRDMGTRLAWVLRESNPWVLPNSVEAEERETAIRAAVARGHRVVIVPYKRVAEGINLQDCIDSICWVELAQNLFHLDQASRRAWRLGRAYEVRLFYFAYAGSAAHRKLQKLGAQSGAAAAFAGEPAHGALAAHVGADQTTLARLSHSLETLDAATDTDLQAQFDRRGRELEAALARGRQWMGIDDPLPALLEPIYAELTAAAQANTTPPPAPNTVSPSQPLAGATPQSWADEAPVPPPLPVMARVHWDDPDLFRKAHPRIAARRAKAAARAGNPAALANQKPVGANTTQPFPSGSLWAILAPDTPAMPPQPTETDANPPPTQLTLFA